MIRGKRPSVFFLFFFFVFLHSKALPQIPINQGRRQFPDGPPASPWQVWPVRCSPFPSIPPGSS